MVFELKIDGTFSGWENNPLYLRGPWNFVNFSDVLMPNEVDYT